ncbi:NAD(P)H-dependent flavin oxidoreductase [Staphylococcus canis]|uniref:NAD(P)H-dependent flavin oxidoreductase n=1 Tax=Staphylococcus canis TaxID=2724942 RepID=UPI003D814EA4
MWAHNDVMRLCRIELPIIQAGMAGSTTPELVAAVSNSGALGTIGAGYMSSEALEAEIQKVQSLTLRQFAVNLFVPEAVQYDETQVKAMNALLQPYRQALGLEVPTVSSHEVQSFDDKIKLLIEYQVPICSFTFGIPTQATLDKLKRHHIITIGSATTVEEAEALENAGVDLIVAQGSDAGGHRGSFKHEEHGTMVGTMALVPQIVDHVNTPVIAAGGIMDGRGVLASMMLGAQGAQLGTAFLTTKESKAKPSHKQAIFKAKETDTTVTNIFSGKMARGLNNTFIQDLENQPTPILPYPIQNDLTSPIRSAAGQIGKVDWMHLWSGQGVRLAQDVTATQLIEEIVTTIQQLSHQLSKND